MVPSPEGLRRAVSAMMRKTVMAETARSGPALVTRWRVLATNPGELHTRPGELLWPSTSPPTPEQGNEFFPYKLYYMLNDARKQGGGGGKLRNCGMSFLRVVLQ